MLGAGAGRLLGVRNEPDSEDRRSSVDSRAACYNGKCSGIGNRLPLIRNSQAWWTVAVRGNGLQRGGLECNRLWLQRHHVRSDQFRWPVHRAVSRSQSGDGHGKRY
jgi:hypothetical protein